MSGLRKGRGRVRYRRVLVPARRFWGLVLLRLEGRSSVASGDAREEALRLRETVLQDAVQCYALEGFYPEDLNYLEEHYGLSYDSKKYVVSYEVIGSNLMPDVTVIPLKERGAGS